MYDEPFYASGSYDESGDFIKYMWREKHSEKEEMSDFSLTLDKRTKVASVTRNGDINSIMNFDPENDTRGALNTAWGIIDVKITTHYVNIPNALTNAVEISYTIDPGSTEPVKNTFLIKRLLQSV
jgi:uncharacterized beta-barrel protein YwiB (DUF1934 family)